MQTSNEELCTNLPEQFMDFFKHVKTLNFEDKPNFEYIKGCFQDILKNLEMLNSNIDAQNQ